jgi:aminomethyltransferase
MWLQSRSEGISPVGLGARDTLRLEAGLRLWGSDMDTMTTPYEAGLEWTVAINKPSFIGKAALVTQRESGPARKLVGFELSQGPVPRHGMELMVDRQRPVGTVTSGTFSPLLKKPIGMGYVERGSAQPGTELALRVRHQWYPVHVVKLPFWKPAPVVHDSRLTTDEPTVPIHGPRSSATEHGGPVSRCGGTIHESRGGTHG